VQQLTRQVFFLEDMTLLADYWALWQQVYDPFGRHEPFGRLCVFLSSSYHSFVQGATFWAQHMTLFEDRALLGKRHDYLAARFCGRHTLWASFLGRAGFNGRSRLLRRVISCVQKVMSFAQKSPVFEKEPYILPFEQNRRDKVCV